jgi:hypothetical protein
VIIRRGDIIKTKPQTNLKTEQQLLLEMKDSLNFVVVGIAQWLHDGWCHSYPAGYRHRRGTDQGHSGTKTIVAISTLPGEGEVFGKEVVSRFRKILLNLASVENIY